MPKNYLKQNFIRNSPWNKVLLRGKKKKTSTVTYKHIQLNDSIEISRIIMSKST